MENGKIIAEGYPKRKLDIITKALPDVSGKDILDIGSNSGFFGITMAQRGANVILNEAVADNRQFAEYLMKYVGVQIPQDSQNLFPHTIAKYEKKADYVFALAVVQHIFRRVKNLDTIFRLLQTYAREGVIVEYCGDRPGYVQPGHDYEAFMRSLSRVFDNVQSLGPTLPNRELFLAKPKKSTKQYITIAGLSQTGKKTLIKKLGKDEALCQKLGIESPHVVFGISQQFTKTSTRQGPWKQFTPGIPLTEMHAAETIIHFWQPKTDSFIKLWEEEYPQAHHRILIPARPIDAHLKDFNKVFSSETTTKQRLLTYKHYSLRSLIKHGISIEILDSQNGYKIIGGQDAEY